MASNEPECELLPSAKSSHTAAQSSRSIGLASPATTTLKHLPQTASEQMEFPLMSSAEASRVRIFLSPERAKALQAAARAYGRSSPELLAKYDPDTSSWRTSQLCLDGDLQTFSETWPRSGTMRNGIAYQLSPLVPLTDAIGSGSWPTPHSNMSTGPGTQGRDGGMNLQTAIGGLLNPTWVEWLMGFPLGWTALKDWATRSSRKSQKSSEEQS